MCLNQLFRPEIYIPQKGVGNCKTCQPNEKNKNCRLYTPIGVITQDVEIEEN